ncbi:hypothetical protein BMS3Bbin04_01714 [bacterium BMS3Bbin04]|nr:hypothetical protein BMS3Bbin04_01714 [bacterium BMS3Bbin04]
MFPLMLQCQGLFRVTLPELYSMELDAELYLCAQCK